MTRDVFHCDCPECRITNYARQVAAAESDSWENFREVLITVEGTATQVAENLEAFHGIVLA